MDQASSLHTTLVRSVERVLAALFRVLLRHGMSFTAFESIAKRVYVDVALREFGIPGKKPSISRASILSGLTRKEVQRLVAEADERSPQRRPARAREPRRAGAHRLDARRGLRRCPTASRACSIRPTAPRALRAGAAPQRRHAGARGARRADARRRRGAPPDGRTANWCSAPTCAASAPDKIASARQRRGRPDRTPSTTTSSTATTTRASSAASCTTA